MFKKILIANRGEIACRIIETARRMGIQTVAVYSDADAEARHVRMADEAVHIGGAASKDSYLKGDVIIDAARRMGAEAIHPGYGFLSENEAFARSCAGAGIVFIGPSPEAINAMGLKDRAKTIMHKAGVPVVPGYQGDNQDPAFLRTQADGIGYPVLIKAVAGGGGKGMRLVEKSAEFIEALASCQREAKNAFGNDHVLIEKYINKPRHVEVQVFGDSHGNAVYLYERDCSLQRRHQKVVEEAPAPGLPANVRKALGEAAVTAVKALKYANAGTIEFIMDATTHDFFFMEMNTRLQVEHPVTEMITGQNLVEWQLRVAAGEKLPLAQKDIPLHGHAFEVRLYAEDPSNNFLPQIGRITRFIRPALLSSPPSPVSSPRKRGSGGSGAALAVLDPGFRGDDNETRIDTGVDEGDSVTIYYDPMIAKIIVHGSDRKAAVVAMQDALAGTAVNGLITNQEFLANVFAQQDFIKGDVDTGFIARHEDDLLPTTYGRAGRGDLALAVMHFLAPAPGSVDPWNNGDNWRLNGVMSRPLTLAGRDGVLSLRVAYINGVYKIEHEGELFTAQLEDRLGDVLTVAVDGARVSAILIGDSRKVTIFNQGRVIRLAVPAADADGGDHAGGGRITAPMPGRIVSVLVGQGDSVAKDQPLLIMEAMKMEMTIRATLAGEIEELPVAVNDQVGDGALLVAIKADEAA